MPNYNQSEKKAIISVVLGIRVDRATEALAAALTPLFTIVGGKVLMTGFYGVITTASGANLTHLEATPTTGTSQPVCADLDINPAIVGDVLTITGVGNAAMTYNASVTGLPMMASKGVILSPGTLDVHPAAADGAVEWTMFYIPLDDGAYVTAT